MTTIREAAQQALEALEGGADSWQLVGPAIDALRAALAEPVQEPYAWMAVGGTIWRHKSSEDDLPLYTAPRVPLAEWQINDLMADIDPEDRDSWSFRQGVYAAEKHHGVRK